MTTARKGRPPWASAATGSTSADDESSLDDDNGLDPDVTKDPMTQPTHDVSTLPTTDVTQQDDALMAHDVDVGVTGLDGHQDQLINVQERPYDLLIENTGRRDRFDSVTKTLLKVDQITLVVCDSAVIANAVMNNIQQFNHLAGGKYLTVVAEASP